MRHTTSVAAIVAMCFGMSGCLSTDDSSGESNNGDNRSDVAPVDTGEPGDTGGPNDTSPGDASPGDASPGDAFDTGASFCEQVDDRLAANTERNSTLAQTDRSDDGPRNSGHYYHVIEVDLVAGQSYFFDMLGDNTLDTYLFLMDADCNNLIANDDFDVTEHSRFEWTATDTGPHFLVPTTFGSNAVGDYLLTFGTI